jgi:hypothetical protein
MDVTGILKLSDHKFKIIMANMPGALRQKVDNMQGQMDNISREMEILMKNQKQMLENKNTLMEMKNAFDGLISRLGTAEESISELQEMTIETFKTGKRKKTERNGIEYARTEGPQMV